MRAAGACRLPSSSLVRLNGGYIHHHVVEIQRFLKRSVFRSCHAACLRGGDSDLVSHRISEVHESDLFVL